jgi:hypothetical protein
VVEKDPNGTSTTESGSEGTSADTSIAESFVIDDGSGDKDEMLMTCESAVAAQRLQAMNQSMEECTVE